MHKIVDLLRHGEPELQGVYLGRTDSPLSEHGRQTSAEAMQSGDWDLVISSPLQRCRESASCWAECHDRPLLLLESLQEYDFGEWDGEPCDRVYAQYPEAVEHFWRDPLNYPPPAAEPLADFCARLDAVQRFIHSREEQRILVVTHGGVIRGLIAAVLGVAPANWSRIKVDYSRLTRLRFDYDSEQVWPQLLHCNVKALSDDTP
ncbi:histidine phosphatase family protein [Neptuniibacter halophilus]|uniref:histidine phosphatase family protein n=1 Tax=Neptuniibacter halophilus TaxID=651666 RepID=UPI0025738B29|nr:histidine phosphatase family protein [Neptuniibacter halophilus]